MHPDRGRGKRPADAGPQPSELDELRARCWRQATEISALGDTISVLRRGAADLALHNVELRSAIGRLETRIGHAHARRGSRRLRSEPSAGCW